MAGLRRPSRRPAALPVRLLAATVVAQWPGICAAAGGQSLWDLGDIIDANPINTFMMYIFTVVLILIIENIKHKVDHGTKDPHRKQALQNIYSELMIMGVVAFLLILGAELGLMKLEIRKPWCTNEDTTTTTDGSAAAATDGSGSAAAHRRAHSMQGPPNGPTVAAPVAAPASTSPAALTGGSDAAAGSAAPAAGSGAGDVSPGGSAGGSAAVAAGTGSGSSWGSLSDGSLSGPPPCPVCPACPSDGSLSAATDSGGSLSAGSAVSDAIDSGSLSAATGSGGSLSAATDSGSAATGSGSGGSLSAVTAANWLSGSGSSSGSGTDHCVMTFNILLFEYAHLVLFFMGLGYAAFIQIAFYQRNRMCRNIKQLQDRTLASWLPDGFRPAHLLSIMGATCKNPGSGAPKTSSWARAILILRAGMAVKLQEEMRCACDPSEAVLEEMLAKLHGTPPPAPRAHPDEVRRRFDIARFTHCAMGEVLMEMLHVPSLIWLVVVVMAVSNVIHEVGVDLAAAVLGMSLISPILAVIMLYFMSRHMRDLTIGIAGHPDCPHVEFGRAHGPVVESYRVPARLSRRGEDWANDEHAHPWHEMDGCIPDDSAFNAVDPLDPHNIVLMFQAIIFASCFNFGQDCMLSILVYQHLGAVALIFCWAAPIFALVIVTPRALLIFALCHRTADPPRPWLLYALKERDDPPAGHGHGGGHGHGHGSGHDHGDDDSVQSDGCHGDHAHLSADDIQKLEDAAAASSPGGGAHGALRMRTLQAMHESETVQLREQVRRLQWHIASMQGPAVGGHGGARTRRVHPHRAHHGHHGKRTARPPVSDRRPSPNASRSSMPGNPFAPDGLVTASPSHFAQSPGNAPIPSPSHRAHHMVSPSHQPLTAPRRDRRQSNASAGRGRSRTGGRAGGVAASFAAAAHTTGGRSDDPMLQSSFASRQHTVSSAHSDSPDQGPVDAPYQSSQQAALMPGRMGTNPHHGTSHGRAQTGTHAPHGRAPRRVAPGEQLVPNT